MSPPRGAVTNIDDDGPITVTIDSIAPSLINAGDTNVPFVILGSGFQMGASITFENGTGPAPEVSDVTVILDAQICAVISVSKGGPRGTRTWDVR